MASEKIHTINVVEFPDSSEPTNIYVTSFNDNEQGNIEAEKLMFALAKENGCQEKYIDEFLDEWGDVYEDGTYMVLITHS